MLAERAGGEQEQAEQKLLKMIHDAGLKPQAAYQPGEVQIILCISSTSFMKYCNEWEPEEGEGNPRGLECYRLSTHRRVPHHALVDWLRRNQSYERDNA